MKGTALIAVEMMYSKRYRFDFHFIFILFFCDHNWKILLICMLCSNWWKICVRARKKERINVFVVVATKWIRRSTDFIYFFLFNRFCQSSLLSIADRKSTVPCVCVGYVGKLNTKPIIRDKLKEFFESDTFSSVQRKSLWIMANLVILIFEIRFLA